MTVHAALQKRNQNTQVAVPTQGDTLAVRERYYLSLYREDENGCWIFQGTVVSTGYGSAGSFGMAHRFFYEKLVGPIPEGLHIDHLCRVRGCVNPGHLEPVPPGVNTLRGMGAGALNARKTHCSNGHELAGDNVRIYRGTWRQCRACNRDYSRAAYHRKKAAS